MVTVGVPFEIEAGEVPFHPLYRTLLVANTLYSSDRSVDYLPTSGRRVTEQIAILEMLREKKTCSKEELLQYFTNPMGLFRYLTPLMKIGLLRKERSKDGTLLFHFDKTVQLDLAEESRRVQQWLSETPTQNGGAVTVETPLGFLKLQPAVESGQSTE